MKKEKKFLDELEFNLKKISKKNKDIIIHKYSNIIKERKSNNERIVVILKSLGSPKEIALKEISEIKKNQSLKIFFKNIFSYIMKILVTIKTSFIKTFSKVKVWVKNDLNNNKKNNSKKKENKEKEHIEIEKVAEIVTEKKIFETKEERKKRIALKTLSIVITAVLLFALLFATVVFIASLFAYLDGVKLIGINIALFSLNLLILSIISLINKSILNIKVNRKYSFILIIILVILIGIGIGITIKQIYDINITSDVSEKYSMTKKISSYNLLENKKLFITFNSNYKTNYIVEYDNTLENKVSLEVKYYECFYDYFVKKDNNNLYISLKLNTRDRLSVYIDDIKDKKIYDNDELERYVVKISLNEKDKDRIVIK